MRIAIASVQVPFIAGGAEAMTEGLSEAILAAGHQVEVITMPFQFSPINIVSSSMIEWLQKDFDRFDCGHIDQVIALKFPAYYLSHKNKKIWLMHQHRSVYELFDTPFGESSNSHEASILREKVKAFDNISFANAAEIFTISKTVSNRVKYFNGFDTIPLYQPPPYATMYEAGAVFPYIFIPSRLEGLKRQELIVRAMKNIKEPLFAVIAGDGGQFEYLRKLVELEGLQHRVKFVGRLKAEAFRRYYSNAFLVFFGPYLEDYGFVTLEAMLSAKPVITCTDSGGPTEFVINDETGRIVEPDEQAVADAVNSLWANKKKAVEMGVNGLSHYHALNITWANVIEKLLGD